MKKRTILLLIVVLVLSIFLIVFLSSGSSVEWRVDIGKSHFLVEKARGEMFPHLLRDDDENGDGSKQHTVELNDGHRELLARGPAGDVILGTEPEKHLDAKTIRRIVKTTDPLYHGQLFSRHAMLPTAHHDIHSVPIRPANFDPAKDLAPVNASSAAATNLARMYRESFNEAALAAGDVMPACITSTFKDGDVLRDLLDKWDAPFRHWVFINNANDATVNALMDELAPLEGVGAVTILRPTGFNRGFACATNLGLRRAREILKGRSEFDFITNQFFSPAASVSPQIISQLTAPADAKLRQRLASSSLWFFSVNCDAIFPKHTARILARGINARIKLEGLQAVVAADEARAAAAGGKASVNNVSSSSSSQLPGGGGAMMIMPSGLFYGTVLDQYAFAISDAVVDAIGFFDEVFYPAYGEDIDYKWRANMAGFLRFQVMDAEIGHHRSINLKREPQNDDDANGNNQNSASEFKRQLFRAGAQFEYGWSKHGRYEQDDTPGAAAPARRKFVFTIPHFPLHLWRVDPDHRRCIVTGEGTYFVDSTTCWYNISNTGIPRELNMKVSQLPHFLQQPTVSLRDYVEPGTDFAASPMTSFLWFFGVCAVVAIVSAAMAAQPHHHKD